jgi:hypothetical protein
VVCSLHCALLVLWALLPPVSLLAAQAAALDGASVRLVAWLVAVPGQQHTQRHTDRTTDRRASKTQTCHTDMQAGVRTFVVRTVSDQVVEGRVASHTTDTANTPAPTAPHTTTHLQ